MMRRAMAAFARQVVAQFGAGIAGEGHALFDQPADRLAATFDDITGDLLIAQAGAGVERNGEVAVGAVGRVQHGGNAALCPIGSAVRQAVLADQRDLAAGGKRLSATDRPPRPAPMMATSTFMDATPYWVSLCLKNKGRQL
jgi:hypothetical protein